MRENKSRMIRSTSQPLNALDLNFQPTSEQHVQQYLAESSRSRKAKAMGMVRSIGRALSLTKSKQSATSNPPIIGVRDHGPIQAYQGIKPRPLKPPFTGPTMTPLKGISDLKGSTKTVQDTRRNSHSHLPLRSRQIPRKKLPHEAVQQAHVSSNSLYNSDWNHSRHALSLFEVAVSSPPTTPGKVEMITTKYERAAYERSQLDPRITRSVLVERHLNTTHDTQIPTNFYPQLDALDGLNTITPLKRSRRKPVSSRYLSDSFESLVNSNSLHTEEGCDPLNIVRTPGSKLLSKRSPYIRDPVSTATPPTPNFGESGTPSPAKWVDASFVFAREADQNPLSSTTPFTPGQDVEAETSFDRPQNDLFDEVLTTWDLPPMSLSRSNSLILERLPSSKSTLHEQKTKLSESTGTLLNSRPVQPVPTFYPSGRSFEPIRAAQSGDRLHQHGMRIDNEGNRRKLGGRTQRAVENLEGPQREITESPPTPWKRMAALLKPKSSDSSFHLRDDTKKMMLDARKRRSKSTS
ncbi:uncharacterized protein I206_101763 [Kwoniella pini CBS 10737]|uniref:Uncharacterized protein n=1 Tax=Kwoniella pini CBS 10737 TaxID=1296096 RepID=A0A1B9HVS0_9TREE|nr:uncharacterized protein I206_06266 [Kwoniella pini CBS 10737]OCF47370.1 hypothetical protein I206_06266 [Kwoniella pini CBS 10737]